MKKSLIFWLAAVTCAAWILVGCEQEPETKTNTVTNGAAADIASLQLLLDEPGVNPVYYKGVVALTGDQLVVPAGKTLVAADGVTVDATSVFAVAGTLSLGAGKGIAVSGAGTVVGNQGVLDSVTGASAVKATLYNSITAAKEAFTDGDSPVDDAAVLNEDSGNLTDTNIPSGKTLYVLGDLTTNTAPTLTGSGGGVKVLGNFVFGATLDISSYPANYDYSNAVLKTSAAITLTLPATVAVRAINAAAGKLTVAGAGASLTVGSLTGNLALPASVGTVTINDGTGSVEGAALTATGAVTFNNTGTAAFSGNVSLGGDLTVGGVAAISGALTGPAGSSATITFNGATASIGSYTTKASNADTFTGDAALTIATLTGADAASTVTFNNEEGTTIGSYAAKATANATTFEGTSALTITTLTDITSASKVVFNGPATITNPVTTLDSGLTIGGTGAVTLTAAPAITNGLTVTNTTGVTMPSVTGVASKSIDASAGKVIFGTADNSVTITNGTLTSGASTALAGASAGGSVTLANGASLVLADTGTIVVAGTGSVALENSTFGAGTYTATGEVTISSVTAGDTIVTAADDTTHKLAVGVLLLGEASTASTNAATYTLVKSNAGDKVSLDAANGKITLPADTGTTKGASLTATEYCGITLAAGSIELGRKASGAGAGKLALATGTTIGVFDNTTSGNVKITAAGNMAGSDNTAAASVTLGSGNSGGTITGTAGDVYGANGAAGYAVINKGTALSS